MPQKKKPQRMCVACGEMKDKPELIRIVRSPEGEISIDLTGKSHGRGAYICKSEACFLKLKKSGRLSKHLGVPVPEETYTLLESEIKNIE